MSGKKKICRRIPLIPMIPKIRLKAVALDKPIHCLPDAHASIHETLNR